MAQRNRRIAPAVAPAETPSYYCSEGYCECCGTEYSTTNITYDPDDCGGDGGGGGGCCTCDDGGCRAGCCVEVRRGADQGLWRRLSDGPALGYFPPRTASSAMANPQQAVGSAGVRSPNSICGASSTALPSNSVLRPGASRTDDRSIPPEAEARKTGGS